MHAQTCTLIVQSEKHVYAYAAPRACRCSRKLRARQTTRRRTGFLFKEFYAGGRRGVKEYPTPVPWTDPRNATSAKQEGIGMLACAHAHGNGATLHKYASLRENAAHAGQTQTTWIRTAPHSWHPDRPAQHDICKARGDPKSTLEKWVQQA